MIMLFILSFSFSWYQSIYILQNPGHVRNLHNDFSKLWRKTINGRPTKLVIIYLPNRMCDHKAFYKKNVWSYMFHIKCNLIITYDMSHDYEKHIWINYPHIFHMVCLNQRKKNTHTCIYDYVLGHAPCQF